MFRNQVHLPFTRGFLPPTAAVVISMYAALKGTMTVAEFMRDPSLRLSSIEPRYFKFDIRRFIVFGVVEGIIRRVHRYPILLSTPTDGPKIPYDIAKLLNGFFRVTVGMHHLDDLCTRFKRPVREMQEMLSAFNIQYIYK